MRLSWMLPLFLGVALFGCREKEPEVSSSERDEALFVQNARSGTFNGKEITLNQISPVIYFTQSPRPEAGVISTTEFNDLWTKGHDALADTTKATLSIHTPQGDKHVAVELMSPLVSGNRITYKVRVLLGTIPRQFNESTLFIDFGDTWRVPQGETL